MQPTTTAPHEDVRYFDLNIEEYLESWTTTMAVRELIANALDESFLTSTRLPTVTREGTTWIIRDWGRGLQPEHFTLNENEEKQLAGGETIGMFGVGLKDALATLHRSRCNVEILSQHARFGLSTRGKEGFADIPTLHAVVSPPDDPNRAGTEIRLSGITDQSVQEAKEIFLRYSSEKVLEPSPYGAVLERREGQPASIYIRGVKMAEEEDFLFSYNVTSLTETMKKGMNRERANVGRAAYTDRVKKILIEARSDSVVDSIAEAMARDSRAQELEWVDVGVHACKLLNARGRVLFVDFEQATRERSSIDHEVREGARLVRVPQRVMQKLQGAKDYEGRPLRTLQQAAREWTQSFQFRWVEPSDLGASEQQVYSTLPLILDLLGGRPSAVKDIRISETMRPQVGNPFEVVGLWEPAHGRIVVKRSQLDRLESFAGTVAHEIGHARSGRADVDRDFEQELTSSLGRLLAAMIELRAQPTVEETSPAADSGKTGEAPMASPPQKPVPVPERQAQGPTFTGPPRIRTRLRRLLRGLRSV